MSNLFVLSIVTLQLWSAKPPSPPTVFLVGYDCSASVPAPEFSAYPEMIRSAVLELVRPGDTVVLVRLDRPNDPPETFVFESHLSRLRAAVVQIYARLHALQQSRGRHGTDIGLAFDHLRRRVELDRRLNPSVRRQYVVVAVTDGVSDGHQTRGTAQALSLGAADWRVAFLGVKPDVEPNLRRSAVQNGFDDPARILVVPFSHWSQLRPSLAGFVGRSPNPTLTTALARASRSKSETRR